MRIGDLAKGLGRASLAFLACLTVLLCWPIAAGAQSLAPAEKAQLERQKEELFQRTLQNPKDLDATFAFADVSARLGDNEAAVTALERMLLFNPNLTRVQLELGVLYFRMASFELARAYFEKALASDPPPEVRGKIEQYLRQISVVASSEQITGYVFFGVQGQSDANAAPGSPLIHSPIGDALLSSQFVKQADANIFAAGQVLYSYDLHTQDRDTLEVLASGFANHYFSVSRLDLTLGELTIGPRINFPDPMAGIRSLSLKPYLILNNVSLGGNEYFYTYGGGGELQATIGEDLSVRTTFEYREKRFSNAADRPLSTGLDGNDKLVSVQVGKPVRLFADDLLSLQFDFLDQSTRVNFYTNKTYGGSAAYHVRYDDPTGQIGLPWETTVFGSRTYANYAAPDPCCSTSGNPAFFSPSSRLDRRWRFGITQNIPVVSNVAMIVQLQRDIVSSNLSLYAYTSNSVLVGAQIRF